MDEGRFRKQSYPRKVRIYRPPIEQLVPLRGGRHQARRQVGLSVLWLAPVGLAARGGLRGKSDLSKERNAQSQISLSSSRKVPWTQRGTVVRTTYVMWAEVYQPGLKTFPTSRHIVILQKKGVTVQNSGRKGFEIEEKYIGERSI